MVKKKTARGLPVCKNCSRGFVPKRRSQKYCSDTCREDYYKAHYFIKTTVEKVCPNCGITFSTTKPTKQIYCKPECREEARIKRMEGLGASIAVERQTYLGERMTAFEHDGFKCTVCGRGRKDGAVLDVVEEGTSLVTVCIDCKAGKATKRH